jgi:hypothetical protein
MRGVRKGDDALAAALVGPEDAGDVELVRDIERARPAKRPGAGFTIRPTGIAFAPGGAMELGN